MDKNDNPTGRYEQIEEMIPDAEKKAQAVIYFETAQNAISAYYHLKALRNTYSKSEKRWFHVAFPLGRVAFSPVHYNKLSRFAENIYTLFDSDQRATLRARTIGRRYRKVLRASLPVSLLDPTFLRSSRVFAQKVHTVRDFFLAYGMSKEESYLYDNDINRRFAASVTAALSSCPMERKEKRSTKGVLKEVYYVIDPASVWEFMAAEGYFRDVDPDSTDKIGRFVHISGPFADELDSPSMVARTNECLDEYAKQNATDSEEYRLMRQLVEIHGK